LERVLAVPAVERSVAGVVHVVETLTQFDQVLVSAASLDDRVGEVTGQPVYIDCGHPDRLDVLTHGFQTPNFQ
jgi:hypothetical protein